MKHHRFISSDTKCRQKDRVVVWAELRAELPVAVLNPPHESEKKSHLVSNSGSCQLALDPIKT